MLYTNLLRFTQKNSDNTKESRLSAGLLSSGHAYFFVVVFLLLFLVRLGPRAGFQFEVGPVSNEGVCVWWPVTGQSLFPPFFSALKSPVSYLAQHTRL